MKNNISIESLIGIFTVEDGEIKILLTKQNQEPYKGHWILLGKDLDELETLEDNVKSVIVNQAGLPNINDEQCRVFSSLARNPEKRQIAVTFIGLVDNVTVKLKTINTNLELAWFNMKNLPKMGFDHNEILEYMINVIKQKVKHLEIMKAFFPSEFTIPDLQKTYENLAFTQLDRRNFRKKLFDLNIIENTGHKRERSLGRPAKLYKFKENISESQKF